MVFWTSNSCANQKQELKDIAIRALVQQTKQKVNRNKRPLTYLLDDTAGIDADAVRLDC